MILTGATLTDPLSVLCRAEAGWLIEQAEALLPELQDLGLEVLLNRTALTLLPMQDTVSGQPFYLGEVLLAEAQVRVGEQQGYAAVVGRDLVQALAAAVLDAAGTLPQFEQRVTALIGAERVRQAADDDRTLREIEATRVEMETF
ncbi:phosphonate C-P lyase system protein PhnG [Deinococcus sp.]|uniref:phosphonate C-P lyase system protein PhnG n=1 Tax=Deinococcus sp. TaxID=47478 RepID=UPI0025EF85CC|nr:phosphonate C-P lyase system protein PhnG [Deinococcus sp.]